MRALPLPGWWALALATGVGAMPGPVHAQRSSPPPAPRPAAELLLKTTRLEGADRQLLGGWLGLRLGDHWSVGGGGYALLRKVGVAGAGPGTSFQLGMGYGGLVVQRILRRTGTVHPALRVLLGAGNAEVTDPLVGNELGADNFLVIEPEFVVRASLRRGLRAGLAVGYRVVQGVQDLPGVSAGGLRGFTATLALGYGTG